MCRVHPSAGYVRRPVGNCDGLAFIGSTGQCAAAAVELGLADVTPLGSTAGSTPHGCFVLQSNNSLYFNAAGDRNDNGTNRISLCKPLFPFHTPTGSPKLVCSAVTGSSKCCETHTACCELFFRSFRLQGRSPATLPDGVFDVFTGLTFLDLGRNDLATLSDGMFGTLTGLRTLQLGKNEFTMLPDGVFGNLTDLDILYLGNNKLSTVANGLFEALASLTVLSLFNNNLATLPAGVFDALTSLRTLNLENNRLTTVPAGVFAHLTDLVTLYLANNELVALPDGVFDALTSIVTIDLKHNRLTTLPDGVFDDLTGLTFLGLNNNDLIALPNGVFDDLTNLTTLYLGNNNLATLPHQVFDALARLGALHLNNNDLSTLADGVFDALTRLSALYLRGNPLLSVPVALFQNQNITPTLPNFYPSGTRASHSTPASLNCHNSAHGRFNCTGCHPGMFYNASSWTSSVAVTGPAQIFDFEATPTRFTCRLSSTLSPTVFPSVSPTSRVLTSSPFPLPTVLPATSDSTGSGLWIPLTIVLVLGAAVATLLAYRCHRRWSNTERYPTHEQLDPVASTAMVSNPVFGQPGTNRQPAAAAVHSAIADPGPVAYDDADIDPNDTPQYAVATTPDGIYQVAHQPTKTSESSTYSVLSAPAARRPKQSAVYDDAYSPTDSAPAARHPEQAAVYDDAYAPTDATPAAWHPEPAAAYDDAYAPTDNSDAAGTDDVGRVRGNNLLLVAMNADGSVDAHDYENDAHDYENGGVAVAGQYEAPRPVGGGQTVKYTVADNGASGPASTV